MCSSSVIECDRFFLLEKAKNVCSKTFLPNFFFFCICKIYIFSVLYVVMRRLSLIFVVVHFYIIQHREMWNLSRGNSSRCLIVIKTLRKLKQKIELKDMKAGTLEAGGFSVVANFTIGLCEVCGETLKSLCNTASCGAKSCSFQSSCAVGNLSSVKLTTLALDPNGNCRAILWKFCFCHLDRYLRFKGKYYLWKLYFKHLNAAEYTDFKVLYRKVIILWLESFFF